MSFEWAVQSPEIREVCQIFEFYELNEPEAFCYKIITGLLQTGPQCGIVALVMCMEEPTISKINEVMSYAKKVGLTNHGELFSVDSMFALATNFIRNNKLEIYTGSLHCDRIVNFLIEGGTMIVPYDCDRNHSPFLSNGNKSHWAVVFGIATSSSHTYVFAKQGKSVKVKIWSLAELAASNQQLAEHRNEKTDDGSEFIMPNDGIAGKHGLANRAVLIYPNNNTICFSSNKSIPCAS